MRYHGLVILLAGITVGGCAQNRSNSPPPRPYSPPTAMEALPSIHDTINADANQPAPGALAANPPALPAPGNPAPPPAIANANASAPAPPLIVPDSAKADAVAAIPPPRMRLGMQGDEKPVAKPPVDQELPSDVQAYDLPPLPGSMLPPTGNAPELTGPANATPTPNTTADPFAETGVPRPARPGAMTTPSVKENAPGIPEPAPPQDPPALEPGSVLPPSAMNPPDAAAITAAKGATLLPPVESGGSDLGASSQLLPDILVQPPTADKVIASAKTDSPRDDNIQRVSGDPNDLNDPNVRRSAVSPSTSPTPNPATAAAIPTTNLSASWGQITARIGDDAITRFELDTAVREWIGKNVPPEQAAMIAPKDIVKIRQMVLADLVDRTLILQEAKRVIKSPKQWDMLTTYAKKKWEDEERQPWMRRTKAETPFDLRKQLEAQGLSLERIQDDYQKQVIAKEFLSSRLGPKMKVDLPALRMYYDTHKPEFQQTANIVWREIVVEVKKHRNRQAAYAHAQDLLNQLRSGKDFAAIAKAHSQGATASEGGLWTTSPGSYLIREVNAEIEKIQIGWLSRVIETPDNFYIVKVESRRKAGTAPFSEVQDAVKNAVMREKIRTLSVDYLEKLRSQTPVQSLLDPQPPDNANAAARPKPG